MITYEEAERLLKEKGCTQEVVEHCKRVSIKADEIAEKINSRGYKVNVALVRIGGMLHDIGRCKTNDVSHGVEGGKIVRMLGEEELARIVERHVGGGIEAGEIDGLPKKDFMPETLEEKVVCYADKLIEELPDGVKENEDASHEIAKLEKKFGKEHPAPKRLKKIDEELKKLMGKG
jgi:uncharacterized protein